VPAGAKRFGFSAPHRRRRGELILRLIALEDLADLEQAHVAKTAVGVVLRGREQTRHQARPHIGELRGDRIGKREPAAAEQFRALLIGERPGHRLDQPARGECALGAAGAHLALGQHRLARALAAIERGGGNAIDAENPHDFLDDIGLALDVGAPRRHRDLELRILPGDREAERAEHAPHLLRVGVQAGEPFELRGRELDPLLLGASVPRDRDFRRRAAAQVEHQFGRELEPGHHEGRIDAALEAITRI